MSCLNKGMEFAKSIFPTTTEKVKWDCCLILLIIITLTNNLTFHTHNIELTIF